MKKNWLKKIRMGRPSPQDGVRDLMSRSAFEHVLECERARADRSEIPFTLLVIDVATPRNRDEYGQSLTILSSVLKRRLRLCDSFGWYGTRVGALLVGAKEEHVSRIWKDIEKAFVEEAHAELSRRLPLPELNFRVYTYPSNLQKTFIRVDTSLDESRLMLHTEQDKLVHGARDHELR